MNNSDFIDVTALRQMAHRHDAQVSILRKWRFDDSLQGAIPMPLYYLSVPATQHNPEMPVTPAFTSVSGLIEFCQDPHLYNVNDLDGARAYHADSGSHPRP